MQDMPNTPPAAASDTSLIERIEALERKNASASRMLVERIDAVLNDFPWNSESDEVLIVTNIGGQGCVWDAREAYNRVQAGLRDLLPGLQTADLDVRVKCSDDPDVEGRYRHSEVAMQALARAMVHCIGYERHPSLYARCEDDAVTVTDLVSGRKFACTFTDLMAAMLVLVEW